MSSGASKKTTIMAAMLDQPNSHKFTGQVAIITGAGSGIGRATAVKMARHGAHLVLADIDPEALSTTLDRCEREGPSIDREHPPEQHHKPHHMTAVLDVRSSEDVNAFVAQVVATYGDGIHHVFNCAGINPTPLETTSIPDEYWHKLVDTNVKSVFAMTRACIPHMRPGSSFVNVSSTCGLHPTAGFAVYCATKYAVVGFSKCMALELGRSGIRVNVVAPGSIETPTNASVRAGADQMQSMAQHVGLRRMGTADEVADVAAFLFSQESAYVNGSVVEINGGVGVMG